MSVRSAHIALRRSGPLRVAIRALSSTASARSGDAAPAWSDPDTRLRPSEHGSSPAGLRPYVVVALDKQVEGTLEKRLAVRDTHLAEAMAGKRVGRVLSGGGLLGSPDFPPTSAAKEETANLLAGSMFIVLAEVRPRPIRRHSTDEGPERVRGAGARPARYLLAPRRLGSREHNHHAVCYGTQSASRRGRPGDIIDHSA